MYFQSGDSQIYYEQFGSGGPIIFLHGWLDDCSLWKTQAEKLAEGHRVILYDLRGHGKSDKPEGECSAQFMVNDLKALIQNLNLKKTTLVGFSFGGMVSLDFTLQNPDKVSKLVLVGAGANMPILSYITVVAMNLFRFRTLVQKVLPRFYFHKPSRAQKDAFVATAMLVPKNIAREIFMDFLHHYDVRTRIGDLKTPTLIISGAKDMAMPVRFSRFLNSGIRQSEMVIIPKSGHRVMVESPAKLHESLSAFLGEGKAPQTGPDGSSSS